MPARARPARPAKPGRAARPARDAKSGRPARPARDVTAATAARAGRPASLAAAAAVLRAHAMSKPEATEHFPWGDRAIKVKGKVFLFMGQGAELSLSAKLPGSSAVALLLPFASPTGYGLGKAGWVSASFGPGDDPPLDMLCAWIDESYQAIAPAKLAKLARGAPAASVGAPAAKSGRRSRAPRGQ
jgi:predicted DNA-binding protein (MmcQ/YjbR family)